MGMPLTKIHIKNDFICCPNCGEPLNILGTVITAVGPRGYAGECRELTCRTLVHFHIQVSDVITPGRLKNSERN